MNHHPPGCFCGNCKRQELIIQISNLSNRVSAIETTLRDLSFRMIDLETKTDNTDNTDNSYKITATDTVARAANKCNPETLDDIKLEFDDF